MPIYEFKCEKELCQNVQEVILNHLPKDVNITCKVCGGKMKPIMSSPGLLKIK